MSYSNSSLNCFQNCMAKYYHAYIAHSERCQPPSPHLTFGTMAHEVLYKAGKLRDEQGDSVPSFDICIPSEVLYPELKIEFGINDWRKYFLHVIKQVSKYETNIITSYNKSVQIERELKLQLLINDIDRKFHKILKEPIVGIIDLLVMTEDKTAATIIDYKFSDKQKTQDDFDQNSQLQLYASFVNIIYGVPLHNIKIGYIDIPKTVFGQPTLLSNGTLSRSKDQNVSADLYKKAVIAIHGENDEKYNCNPGGWYYDVYCNLKLKKAAYINTQFVDEETYLYVMNDLLDTGKMIDMMKEKHMSFLRKYDTYSCKNCEFLTACKPWLNV